MIVMTEIFLIWKHGRNQFSHAYVNPLGYVFLGVIGLIFLTLLVKILISDLINLQKACLQLFPKPQEKIRIQ